MQRCDGWTGEKKQQKLLSAKIVHLSVSSGNSSVKESDHSHLILHREPYTNVKYVFQSQMIKTEYVSANNTSEPKKNQTVCPSIGLC